MNEVKNSKTDKLNLAGGVATGILENSAIATTTTTGQYLQYDNSVGGDFTSFYPGFTYTINTIISDPHEPKCEKESQKDKEPINPKGVRFTKVTKKNKESKIIDPLEIDINYPVKGFFNTEKGRTVLIFKDGTKTMVTADDESTTKNIRDGFIIALGKRVLGPSVRISKDIYASFSDDASKSALYGAALGYFINNKIVKDKERFDRWILSFITEGRIVNAKLNKRPEKNSSKEVETPQETL